MDHSDQLEEILQFEVEEQDRFLATYFPLAEARNYFPALAEQQYRLLMADTKRGIRQGVQDYLKNVNPVNLSSPPSSIYLIDLREFSLRHDVVRTVQNELSGRYSGHRDSYCREVGEGYGSFLYNYSFDEFKKRFSTFSPLPVQ